MAAGAAGALAATGIASLATQGREQNPPHAFGLGDLHQSVVSLDVPKSQSPGAMDLTEFLTHFERGIEKIENGNVIREFDIHTSDRSIMVAPGVTFPAWTFNGTVPGPTLRCTEGEMIRIRLSNSSKHPHTIHFHGIHPASMDGVFEIVEPGDTFTYQFPARPFGLFPYHCHVTPVTKHIAKGLYGTLIVDPDPSQPRTPRTRTTVDHEMVMVMNGFDPNFDEENEFYTVNGIANYYVQYPARVRKGETLRIYLVNMTEFDLINSFHLHGNVFHVIRSGTSILPVEDVLPLPRNTLWELTDTIMLCQGERAILEVEPFQDPGKYMFHAHQGEFAERGWMGFFEVVP